MQINIEKQHFYFLLGLFIVLIGGLFYIAVHDGATITGADVNDIIAAAQGRFSQEANAARAAAVASTPYAGEYIGFHASAKQYTADELEHGFYHPANAIEIDSMSLEEKIRQLESRIGTGSSGSVSSGWPSGHYCILSSTNAYESSEQGSDYNSCPTGFDKTSWIFDNNEHANPTILWVGLGASSWEDLTSANIIKGVYGKKDQDNFAIQFCCK